MKKLFSALLLSVMLLAFAGLKEVKAEDTQPVDPFTWIDQYIADGKTMMYVEGLRTKLTSRGYSGVDVKLGDYVMNIVAGGVDLVSDPDNKLVDGWGSISQLYINDTAQPFDVKRVPSNDYIVLIADGQGRIVEIDNTSAVFVGLPGAVDGKYYDVWWNFDTNQLESRGGANLAHKPRVDFHLTYGDLGTTYKWLTKADVDAKLAAGVTFTDANNVYKMADGTYTNADNTIQPVLNNGVQFLYKELTEETTPKKSEVDANTVAGLTWADATKVFKDSATGKYTDTDPVTPVMNADLGFTIPAGGFAIKFRYLDNMKFNNETYYGQFWKLVNGQPVAQIYAHDVAKPVITGTPVSKNVKPGALITDHLTGVKATDAGLATILTDTTEPTVTYKFQKQNGATLVWEDVTELKFEMPGEKFRVVYSAKDAAGNEAIKNVDYTVIGYNAPVISGTKDIVVNMGTAINLLDGVTADDGYGNNITASIFVSKGNLDVNNPKPGTYEVVYFATNALYATTTKAVTVTVKDTEAPQVIVPTEKVLVKQGTTFDLLSVIYAIDNSGIVKKSIIKNGFFDSSKLGTYEIEAQVSDGDSNSVRVKYTVQVVEDFKNNVDRIEDLEKDLQDNVDEVKGDVTDVESSLQDTIDNVQDTLNGSVGNVKSSLETQLADLQDQMKAKDQQALIFTIVVAVISLAGLGIGFKSIKK